MTAFVLSLGAQCVVGQEMTTAQMACCEGTDHDCQRAGAAEDCCPNEGAEQQLVKQVPPLVPPPAVIKCTIPALVSPTDTYSASDVDGSRLKAVSPPKYVLLASFLI